MYGCFVDGCDGDGCVFDGFDGMVIGDCEIAERLLGEGKGRNDCEHWKPLSPKLHCPHCGESLVVIISKPPSEVV